MAKHNSDLFYTCSLIEYTGREWKVRPSAVPGSQRYQDKHHFRKHGPNAYYGQD